MASHSNCANTQGIASSPQEVIDLDSDSEPTAPVVKKERSHFLEDAWQKEHGHSHGSRLKKETSSPKQSSVSAHVLQQQKSARWMNVGDDQPRELNDIQAELRTAHGKRDQEFRKTRQSRFQSVASEHYDEPLASSSSSSSKPKHKSKVILYHVSLMCS